MLRESQEAIIMRQRYLLQNVAASNCQDTTYEYSISERVKVKVIKRTTLGNRLVNS